MLSDAYPDTFSPPRSAPTKAPSVRGDAARMLTQLQDMQSRLSQALQAKEELKSIKRELELQRRVSESAHAQARVWGVGWLSGGLGCGVKVGAWR